MLEVYLFVNPLGAPCMRSEQNIMKLAARLNSKVSFQIVPLLTQQVVARSLPAQPTLAERNAQFKVHYNAILAYKAALFQGKRKGRDFLLKMQTAVVADHQQFSTDLALSLAQACHLDIDMFKEDCSSDLAKQAFKTDQKLAAEMKITQSPSAVIFNCDVSQCGLLLNDVTYEALCEVCESQGIATKQSLMAEPTYAPNLGSTTTLQPNLHVL
ncbi:MAG: ClpXP adapter SpxH family protein [Levilactobacillus brevis]